jgi:hypothetical protein
MCSSTHSRPGRYEGVGGQHQAPAAFTPREGLGTHCTGGWVGPMAGLDVCEKSRPNRDLIPGPSVAIPTELSGPRIINVTA